MWTGSSGNSLQGEALFTQDCRRFGKLTAVTSGLLTLSYSVFLSKEFSPQKGARHFVLFINRMKLALVSFYLSLDLLSVQLTSCPRDVTCSTSPYHFPVHSLSWCNPRQFDVGWLHLAMKHSETVLSFECLADHLNHFLYFLFLCIV